MDFISDFYLVKVSYKFSNKVSNKINNPYMTPALVRGTKKKRTQRFSHVVVLCNKNERRKADQGRGGLQSPDLICGCKYKSHIARALHYFSLALSSSGVSFLERVKLHSRMLFVFLARSMSYLLFV